MSDRSEFHFDPAYASLMRELGLNAETVFTDPRIRVWRSLPDRENATLDAAGIRLHIKRYPPSAGFIAQREFAGFNLLVDANVPAAPIIAHGLRGDGSSFIILQDLTGYTPADKLLAQGFAFDRLLTATADLAAKLHNSNLHHRDLYLCHFMVKPSETSVDVKLIDMARVGPLSGLFTRRWIVKDLAQFWYSTYSVAVNDAQRRQWLRSYCEFRKGSFDPLWKSIERKAKAIARHDVKLQKQQPGRNVSIG